MTRNDFIGPIWFRHCEQHYLDETFVDLSGAPAENLHTYFRLYDFHPAYGTYIVTARNSYSPADRILDKLAYGARMNHVDGEAGNRITYREKQNMQPIAPPCPASWYS